MGVVKLILLSADLSDSFLRQGLILLRVFMAQCRHVLWTTIQLLQDFEIIRYVKSYSINYVKKKKQHTTNNKKEHQKTRDAFFFFLFKPEAPQRRETTEFLEEENTPPTSV